MVDRSIWQSAQNLMRIDINLGNLIKEFDGLVFVDTTLKVENFLDDSQVLNFCTPVYEVYYSISKRRAQGKGQKFKSSGWITVAVQLSSNIDEDGTDWEHGQRAKVLVGYTPDSGSYEAAWKFDTASPDASGICDKCVANEYKWSWEGSEGECWFYAVPLSKLNSRNQVNKLIIDPLHDVVRGRAVDEVLEKLRLELCLPPESL